MGRIVAVLGMNSFIRRTMLKMATSSTAEQLIASDAWHTWGHGRPARTTAVMSETTGSR